MSRVVVTGGCGFLGSHLVQRLAEQGEEVVVYDPAGPPPDQAVLSRQICHIRGDIRDPATLASTITAGVSTVYHLGGVVGVDRYLDAPLDVIDVTVWGARNVLEAATRAGAKVVIASTSEVFGKNGDLPWTEDADRLLGTTGADRWSYASSKALAEHLTFAFVRKHRLRATIVRYFNVYGPRQRPAYVLSRSIHRALRGLAPVMYDGGQQTRCFTYVDDAVDATLRAGTNGAADGQSFNIGSTNETSVADAVALVARLTGIAPVTVPFDTATQLGDGYQDIPRRTPDTTRARQLLGWRCAIGLETGLARTIDWARSNPWWRELPDGDR